MLYGALLTLVKIYFSLQMQTFNMVAHELKSSYIYCMHHIYITPDIFIMNVCKQGVSVYLKPLC